MYSFLTEIQSYVLQEILFQLQAHISNLPSCTRGKHKYHQSSQSKTDLNNENPCHASSSNEQFKVLHCPLCDQQIKKSLSMDPAQYTGGNSTLISLMNYFKQLLSNISNKPQTCKMPQSAEKSSPMLETHVYSALK